MNDWTGLARTTPCDDMMMPVECRWCRHVHDAAKVTVVQRYADCSVWRCPGCNVLVDDRDPRWGGGVYPLGKP